MHGCYRDGLPPYIRMETGMCNMPSYEYDRNPTVCHSLGTDVSQTQYCFMLTCAILQ